MTTKMSILRALARFVLFVSVSINATSVWATLVTFRVEGHMTWSGGPDLQVGDAFSAEYTFDPSVASIGTVDGIDAQFLAIRDWKFKFAAGYEYAAADSDAGTILLANNNSSRSGGYDRYLATLYNGQAVGADLPSGREVEYFQFYFDDYEPAGNPDLLMDLALPTKPPSIQLSSDAFGRLVLGEALDDFGQPQFQVDSISLVPEPSSAAILAAMATALIAVARHPLRSKAGCLV